MRPFFFPSHVPHRHPHSFPTRRSSDLFHEAWMTPCAFGYSTRIVASSSTRSEEHTSELQSPCKLVYRLLLEKKKHVGMQMRHALAHHLVQCPEVSFRLQVGVDRSANDM